MLVNLFGKPVGEAMAPGAINELLQRLSLRAGLDRRVHPHMLRHGFGSSVKVHGIASDASFDGCVIGIGKGSGFSRGVRAAR